MIIDFSFAKPKGCDASDGLSRRMSRLDLEEAWSWPHKALETARRRQHGGGGGGGGGSIYPLKSTPPDTKSLEPSPDRRESSALVVFKEASDHASHDLPSGPPLFACPYLTHNPEKYGTWKGCRGASYKAISRLKEHLHRKHRQEPNCPRCRETFASEDVVKEHLKSTGLCEVIGGVVLEGFDEAQEKALKSKKRVAGVESEEDKWNYIYRILFPGEVYVPSPYYTPLVLTRSSAQAEQRDIERIFTRDVPSQLKDETCSRMEEAIEGNLSETKRRKVMDICKDFAVKMSRYPGKEDSADEGEATLRNCLEDGESFEVENPTASSSGSDKDRQAEEALPTADDIPRNDASDMAVNIAVPQDIEADSLQWPPLGMEEFCLGQGLDIAELLRAEASDAQGNETADPDGFPAYGMVDGCLEQPVSFGVYFSVADAGIASDMPQEWCSFGGSRNG